MVRVPMRTQEVADRAGKQADGSAKTREAKLVTIWTAESRDEEGQPVRDPGSITYSAAIESAATLDTSPTSRTSRRAYSARPAVVVSEKLNVRWCWAMVRTGFGTRLRNYSRQATQILDRFHAKEHLSQVGKIIYGDSPEGSHGSRRAMMNSIEGCLKSVVQALHGHAGQYKEARECVRYIWNNRRRMRYPKVPQTSFCTSTAWWRLAVKW